MSDQKQPVLFITDKKFVDYTIPGGVQLCTAEFITYIKRAGFIVNIFNVNTSARLAKRVKARLGLEAYEIYNCDPYLDDIVQIINTEKIKFVLFNQLNLSYWTIKIKKRVDAEVKFIGLSHGNESGDYLHDITKGDKATFLQIFRLGKLIIKEKTMFSKLLNGVITISAQETYIDQWLGAENILFLPRILSPNYIEWKPQVRTVGFVGTLDHLPNYGGIDLLAGQLLIKSFEGTLRLVGGPEKYGRALEQKYSFIKYCGLLTNEQLAAEVSTWSVFINPVFWYARGSSTKLSQGLSWGIPVLSTPAGARGYDLQNHSLLTPGNTPSAFASALIAALASPAPLQALKRASEENVASFNLENWAGQLTIFLNSL